MQTKAHSFSLPKTLCIVTLFCAAAVIAALAQSTFFTTLATFDLTNGASPYFMALVQGRDGNFYGTTQAGGTGNSCSDSGCGTVFKITASGTLTTLHSFDGTDGSSPLAGLVQASDGNFYGTTAYGGPVGPNCNLGCGTVFKITPSGTLTTLYEFCSQPNCTDGADPYAPLLQASDGNFYGTTFDGGANFYGTVFKITPAGTLTTLYTFCASGWPCADGYFPYAGLVQGNDGNLYGAIFGGGANGYGTVFKITRDGTLTTLHSFNGLDGAGPVAGLVQGRDGDFYGTAVLGGTSKNCGGGCGTVFKITPTGTFATLYNFCSQPNCTDGANPKGTLTLAADGSLYGTTQYGGNNTNCGGGCGTVFDITAAGTLTTHYEFCPQPGCSDGFWPFGGLLQASDRSFYGTTFAGGGYHYGTVFRLGIVHTCAICRP